MLQVFPETITSSISAGDKARKVARQRREAEEFREAGTRELGKKKKRKSKMDLEIATFAQENLRAPTEDGTETSQDNLGDDAMYTTEEKEESNKSAITRPGVTFSRTQNFLDPYVFGIAVRP